MLVLIHVSIGLLSIAQATFALFAPSRAKLNVVYGLVAGTVASGTYLVWQSHAPLLQSCTTGLMYLATVSVIGALAHRRLAHVRTRG